MTKHKISIALAALAGIASAQTTVVEDATARQQAAAAASKATAAATKAEEAAAASTENKEKIEATEGKLTGLEENYLETKTDVAGLKKLKVSGLIQARVVYQTDTALNSGTLTSNQTQMIVRRGRLKATYDAGNGSVFVTQYDIKPSGLTPQDIYVKWSEPYLKMFSVQMGLQDIPFGYEVSYSSSTMEMLERSYFERNAMFKDEKDVGIIFGADPKVAGLDGLSIKAAMLTGVATKSIYDDPKCFVGRVNLKKDLPDAGVGLALGGSYYSDSRRVVTGGVYYDVDGSTAPRKTNSVNKNLSASVIGLDAQVTVDLSMVPFLAGAKIMGELYTGNAIANASNNERVALATDTLYLRDVQGWYVTLVQNIGTSFQAVARYDVYDPNTNVSENEVGASGTKTSKTDLAYSNWYFGLNYFLNGNTKLTLGYDLYANETSTKLASSKKGGSNLSQEVKDDVVTAQLQFAF
jgi:hypothetical protein